MSILLKSTQTQTSHDKNSLKDFEVLRMSATGISIVVRTFNSSRTLGHVLEKLILQDADELIIVDSGSTDSTLALAQAHGAHIICVKPPFNYSESLNRGFAVASNGWVLVLSSHTIPLDTTFLTVIREFAASAPMDVVVGFGSRVLAAPRSVSKTTFGFERMPKTDFQWGAGNTLAVYRKQAWSKHLFRTDLKTAEDLEWFLWAIREGYSGATIPGAIGIYRNQGNCAHMFRKGWAEEKHAQMLLNTGKKPFCDFFASLFIGTAYLFKLWSFGDLPFSFLARQLSHHIGGCLSAFITNKPPSWVK
jgi:glycosyltransferase involved in cell wall biosynthesis